MTTARIEQLKSLDLRRILSAASYLLEIAVIAASYFGLANIALLLPATNPAATPLWPPTGVALCLVLVALYAFIVIRGLARAMRNDDLFIRFAAAGLAILFGSQAAINIAVNIHLIPAKGMTLPFISYGGSSMISLAYTIGMLLALTREQPRAAMLTPHLSAAEGAA